VSNEGGEWWWIYDMCKKSKLDKCSKNDILVVSKSMYHENNILFDGH
jgi:hypothetical protein